MAGGGYETRSATGFGKCTRLDHVPETQVNTLLHFGEKDRSIVAS